MIFLKFSKEKFYLQHTYKLEYTMLILDAAISDLRTILELQYLAYQDEAKLLNDYEIPELVETKEEIEEEFFNGTILKAVDDLGQIIGSIRAIEEDDTIKVSKLIVHPSYRQHGIGTQLLEELESRFKNKRFEIFASDIIKSNIQFYKNRGYTEFKQEKLRPNVMGIYFQK